MEVEQSIGQGFGPRVQLTIFKKNQRCLNRDSGEDIIIRNYNSLRGLRGPQLALSNHLYIYPLSVLVLELSAGFGLFDAKRLLKAALHIYMSL